MKYIRRNWILKKSLEINLVGDKCIGVGNLSVSFVQ